jgi:pilus assembly protein Flp/PilA
VIGSEPIGKDSPTSFETAGADPPRAGRIEGIDMNLLRRLLADRSGATAIEYGLIASLVAVAIITGAGALGTNLNQTFQNLAGNMK